MRNRLESWLKIGCAVLAAVVLLRLVQVVADSNPLARITVPSPPTLPPDTNASETAKAINPPKARARPGQDAGTNRAPAPAVTKLASQLGTNPTSAVGAKGTNEVGTNDVEHGQQIASGASTSNSAPIAAESTNQTTNATAVAANGARTNTASSNAVSAAKEGLGTNAAAAPAIAKAGIGSIATPGPHAGMAPGLPPELAAMMGMNPMGGAPAPDLPPPVTARINRITDSEILAQVIHPQPMALLGIAGEIAFLRAADGQTGLLKESETLGDIKLLRIGINRVLVEVAGQKKELTIFSGYGGESLLPKSDTNIESAN